MLKELLLFQLLILNSEQCTDPPNHKGINGRIVTSELDCALECKAKHDCYAYQFKKHEDFVSGANTYPSNCILQTIWDWNFLTDDIIESNEYNSKICVALPGFDQLLTEKYIPIPSILVESKAKALGFDKKVEFPEQNLIKYYKVLKTPTNPTEFWQASRSCAAQKGILASPYDANMAKIIHETLELGETGMLIGLTKRDELGPDMKALSRPTYIFDNGKISYGSLQLEAGETCLDWDYLGSIMSDLTKALQLTYRLIAQRFGTFE